MKKKRVVKRIEQLIDRLDNGRYVTRSSLKRVIGLVGLKKFDQEWKLELKSRTYKPVGSLNTHVVLGRV